MMETFIREKVSAKLKNPILIVGLPGLGVVGKIVVTYLIKQLKAKKLAELYSSFFPYHVVVNKNGSVRLLRVEFYFWKNPDPQKNDLLFLTGDSQAQTIDGQYKVVSSILDFAEKYGVKKIITVGGYSTAYEGKEPRVVCVSTNQKLLDAMLKVGAHPSPIGNPIVGAAGLILGLATFRYINAACLLGETSGYMPDPQAAKSILKILQKVLEVEVDLSALDKEVEKSIEVLKKMEEVEKKMEDLEKTRRKAEEGKITYIS